MSNANRPVLVMGAGTVGCFVGGALQAAGADVAFVGRPRVLEALRSQGLTLTDLDGGRQRLQPDALTLHETLPRDLSPSLVLLCVKSGGTAAAAAELGAMLPPGTPVLCLQNGVANADEGRAAAPGLRWLPGMVPFNIAELGPGHVHRGTTGQLAARDDPALRAWLPTFAAAGLPLALHPDMRPVLWGKLLLNLNNPVNALSGLPLRAQLLDAGYRRILASLQREALGVLEAAGIEPARVGSVAPRWLPRVLSLPDWLFRRLAGRMLRMDDRARSSMADDLARGRPVEIDALCGAVVRLARSLGRDAPLNRRMAGLFAPGAVRPGTPAALGSALQRPDTP